MATRKLIPMTEWNKYHIWPSLRQLRQMRVEQESNGFKSAFVKVGRQILIDESEFFNCIDRQNKG